MLFGSSMTGKVTKLHPIDWYVFKAPDDVGDEFLVIYRHISGKSVVIIEVYNSNEEKNSAATSSSQLNLESKSFKVKGAQKATYYIKVQVDWFLDNTVNYELAIRNETADAAK